jgi:hypothetical protein
MDDKRGEKDVLHINRKSNQCEQERSILYVKESLQVNTQKPSTTHVRVCGSLDLENAPPNPKPNGHALQEF